MIKFFRNIRQKLLAESKTSIYFKYAIGEIVLVMIGILLALQINNWNETRKDRVFEMKMLLEIRKALENDIIYFERSVNRLEKLDSATNVMAKHVYEQSNFVDSLSDKGDSRWYLLRTGIQYQYNRGPYEAIKSSGIDRISNDSLRNKLIKLYDFDFPRHEELTKWFDKDYEKQNVKLSSFLGDTKVILDNGQYDFDRTFPEDLFKNKEFINLIGDISRRGKSVGRYLKTIIPKMEEMIAQINHEINQNN
jgi:hypothetical protein